MGLWSWLQKLTNVRSADEFINYRPAENAAMLRQRLALLEASLSACGAPPNDQPDCAIRRDVRALLDKPFSEASWDDVQRCEILLSRILPSADLAPAIDLELSAIAGSAPQKHATLSARWKTIEDAAAAAGAPIEDAAARGVLMAALQESQWRATQNYLIRKLGVVYASRLVTAFLATILFGLALVVWEVYFQSWPLGDARFSGFPMALVAGLLGASFSALTTQRTVATLTNLEEVRTAIGYPMILLRLGVGVSASAILYFFFEAGLVEGVLFPELAAVGFDPVALTTIRGAEGDALIISMEAVREGMTQARDATGEVAEKLAGVTGAIDVKSNAGRAAVEAGTALEAVGAALTKADTGLAGAVTSELGRYVPNAALSKLVVWSFLAGFSEKLVPSILGRVEETTKT